MSKSSKKINFKEKLIDDCLDLSLSGLESVPVKEIVTLERRLYSLKNCFLIIFLIKAEITKARKLNLAYNALTLLPVKT